MWIIQDGLKGVGMEHTTTIILTVTLIMIAYTDVEDRY